MVMLTGAEQATAKRRVLARRKTEAGDKLEEREYLRHEIQARMHVQDLETIASMLYSGYEVVHALGGGEGEAGEGPVTMVPIDKARTAQLLGAANVKLSLLKKVLPDIKAMELTGAGGEELGTDRVMALLELKNRLRAILQPPEIELSPPAYDCLG